MRKWKELSKKEKAQVIFTGILGAVAVGGIATTCIYAKELHNFLRIPVDYPRSVSRVSYRPNLPENMRYAYEIFYTTTDKSAGKFVGEVAVGSKEELAELGKWIADTAMSLGGENNETVH